MTDPPAPVGGRSWFQAAGTGGTGIEEADMTIIATLGAYAGLALLALMAATPLLVELDQRFPVTRRAKAAEREHRVPAGLASA
ncbi:hypothetical protein CFP75_29715 [Amycolatopsis alba DSM 44262]|uniref:Uncharacterized protein n=2 Tax=Amycolatopsis alba TaxID=76020 RepID=A0A229RGM7_AMYAL|nr:hypothetical protein CFP75_29715 [Amycolatopsis alba DSM 44262]